MGRRSSLARDELEATAITRSISLLCFDHWLGASAGAAQELDAGCGVDSGVIEETARLDESYTPIPLKHLASCIEGSR
jgi:hypothetical protein